MAIASKCMFCGRTLATSEYQYVIANLSASQGAGQEPITVCASCNYYFDGTTTGMTEAMRASCTLPYGSFRGLPKDRVLWYLASACSGYTTNTSVAGLSGWFTQIRFALSGGAITPA